MNYRYNSPVTSIRRLKEEFRAHSHYAGYVGHYGELRGMHIWAGTRGSSFLYDFAAHIDTRGKRATVAEIAGLARVLRIASQFPATTVDDQATRILGIMEQLERVVPDGFGDGLYRRLPLVEGCRSAEFWTERAAKIMGAVPCKP